jgi:hypothetical protein
MSESESWSETKIETETNHLLDIKATNHSWMTQNTRPTTTCSYQMLIIKATSH